MNEGYGHQLYLANSYNKGNITKKLFKEICKKQNWEYKFDRGGVLIFSRNGLRPINYPIRSKKKTWLSRYNSEILINELMSRGYVMIKVKR